MTWLYVPGISSASAQVSEDLNSASASLSDCAANNLAASCTSKGKLLQPQAWSRRWKQGGYIRRLSGVTCSPSTLDRGVDLFISSLREIPAKTTPSPESERERTESASSLPKSSVLPKSAGLILSSERTSRGTRTDSLRPSRRHWKDWATALRQEYSVRPKPEIPCAASDCSSWPSAKTVRGGWERDRNGNVYPTLEGAAETWEPKLDWAAPQARDHFPAHSESYIAAKKAEGHGMRNLNDEAAQWMAPNVPNGGRTADHAEMVGQTLYHHGKKVQLGLEHQARIWAGPAAQNHKGSSEGSMVRQDGKSREDILSYQAEQFFRPPSSPDQPIAGGSMSSTDSPNSNQHSAKRKLNPIFVEALMRWPTGLSGFERQATAWTRWQQLMPSFLSMLCSQQQEQKQPDLFGGML